MRILLIVLLLAAPGWACINEYETSEPAYTPTGRRVAPGPGEGLDTGFGEYASHDWPARVKALEARLGAGGDYKVKNDLAAALMRVGEHSRAVKLLEEAEREHPGEYIVAANLGTAYELSGDLEQAYRWIEIGIERNRDAHEGTEWLHLKILTARQGLAADPEWLEQNTVLGLDFGDGPTPRAPAGYERDAQRWLRGLRYQLHERMWFVKPPDPVVADLLTDYANLNWLGDNPKRAGDLYDLALIYRPVREALVETRRNRVAQQVNLGSSLRGLVSGQGMLATAALVVLLVFLGSRRRR